jgi:pilus assembly protein CpaC
MAVAALCIGSMLSTGALFAQTRASAPPAGAQGTGAGAAGNFVTSGLDEQGAIRLNTNKSTIVTTSRPRQSLAIGEPSIADINAISPTRLLVTGKKPGSTQLISWDDQDHSQVIDVTVTADLGGLTDQYKRIFPNNKIEVSSAGEDTVVLSGTVGSLAMAEKAESLAAPYGKKVVNLLDVSGGQQVMLQVRVAEVSRTALSQLGVNLAYTDGTSFGGSNTGIGNGFGTAAAQAVQDQTLLGIPGIGDQVTLFGKGVFGNTAVFAFISALRQNNLLRVLAEPNLVAMSGQEATFLAGGEFPVPIPQNGGIDNNTITIEFKEFGVKLSFVPLVLGDGRIRLKLAPEVSDLDFTNAVRFSGFVIPGLTTRRMSSTVEVGDGQSLAMAGLLNQSLAANKQVTPLLGDLPVLGTLFRSVRYQRKETELVVLVTPRLVSPMSPEEVPTLPGEYWRHPSEAEIFWNQDLGGSAQSGTATTRPSGQPGPARKFYGHYGYVPATQPVAAVPPAKVDVK